MTRPPAHKLLLMRLASTVKERLKFRRSCRWIVWGLFIIALVQRLAWLGSVPPPQATNDEYFYLWSGMSMLEGEAPIAWTMLQGLDKSFVGIFKWKSAEYTMVRPAFDLPPVFSLLTGVSARLAGATAMTANMERPNSTVTLWEVPLLRLRVQSMLLFAAAFWLMWGWLRLAIGPVAALVALLMFSVIDVLVIHQRLVVPDTLTTPLTLACFWALERWRRGWIPSSRAGAIIVLVVGLAGGAKLVALAVVPAVFAWAATLLRGRRALIPCLWACAGAALTTAIVLSFAVAYGFAIFLDTMRAQSNRFTDLGGLVDLIRHQPMIHQDYVNYWIVSGWILAFMGLGSAKGSHRAIFAALAGYIFGFTFFAHADVYGWYILPFAPFLCAAWGAGVRSAWRAPDRPASIVVLLLLGVCAMNNLLSLFPAMLTPGRYAFTLLAILALLPWGFQIDGARRSALRWLIAGLFLSGASAEILNLVRTQRLFLEMVS